MQIVNESYRQLFEKKPRYFILMGGRSAGRSFVASQFVKAKLRAPEYFRCAIMRYILGDVRNSIFQEICDRVEEDVVTDISITDLHFKCRKNTATGLGFRRAIGDQKSKMKSLANFNCVVIEEADEVSEEDFNQLDDTLRTLKADITLVLLLNPPPQKHWIIKRWFNLLPTEQEGFYKPELKAGMDNVVFIHTTYKDNIVNINESTIRNFENYKETQPEHYYSMIRGYVTEGKRGRIYKNWKPISKEKYEALPYPEYYALDFGFTNDPTALVGLKEHNNRVYTRELIYETGMTNQDICLRMGNLKVSKDAKIYGDAAEPKSIEEIKKCGYNIESADKGPGSVNAGIDMLIGKEVFYTDDSANIIYEQENYVWLLDRNKEPTNDPIDKFNHCMDAVRYGVFTKNHKPEAKFGFL